MNKGKLLKNPNGSVLYFYVDENGLCYKKTDTNERPKIIMKNACSDFDVTEKDGEITVICQNDKGGIVCLKENNGVFLKSTLLNNKGNKPYKKHFKLIKVNDVLSVFYIIEHDGIKMLAHQVISSENQTPEIIDRVSGANYYVYSDEQGNIKVIYNNEKIFFRTYSGKWDECSNCKTGRFVCGIYDGIKNLYFVSESEGIYEVYSNDIKENADYLKGSEIVIPYIKNGEFNLLYKQYGRIYEASYNGIKLTGTPALIIGRNNCVVFGTEVKHNEILIDMCFGYFENGNPRLIFFKELNNSELKISYPENNITSCKADKWKEEIAALKKELEKIQKSEKQLKEKIKYIEEFLLKLYEFNNEI